MLRHPRIILPLRAAFSQIVSTKRQPEYAGTRWDARGGSGAGVGGLLRTPSPSHTGIMSRAHTASCRDHVTDTEHGFPVGGDCPAGLTTSKPPVCPPEGFKF